MGLSDDQPRGALPEALALYSVWLREGPDIRMDFEALCVSHPPLRKELGDLHALIKLAQATSLDRSLRGLFGEEADVRLTFEEEETVAESIPAFSPSPSHPSAAPNIPLSSHYAIEGEVARGGMGVIYRVRDRELNRTLAMKVMLGPPSTGSASDPLLKRFLEEVQVTAQLDHPSIVAVHELGLDTNGRPYFTMKLVKGRDLSQILELARTEKEGWNLPRAVGALIKACQAVAFAHSKGVIHRDLKPSNIMVGRFGEIYVMDWGLAKITGRKDLHDIRVAPNSPSTITHIKISREGSGSTTAESPLVTMDGSVVGTPAYMPPEQAKGQIDQVDALSDVYSLGAILYNLLSGHPPYVEPDSRLSPHTILARVLEGPPKRISAANRRARAELVAICEKAMAPEKRDRYPSSLDLAEDLQAWLDHRVVKAYQAGALAEFRSWVVRNQSAAIAGATAILCLLLALGTLLLKNQQVARSRRSAERNLYASLVGESRANRSARRAGYRDEVFKLIRQARSLAVPDRNFSELRSEIVGCLGDFVGVRPTEFYSSSNVPVEFTLIDPSGRVVALALGGTNLIQLREAPSGRLVASLKTEQQLWSVCFSADGSKLVTVQAPAARSTQEQLSGAFIQIWAHTTNDNWNITERLPAPGAYRCLAWEKGEYLTVADLESHSIQLFDLKTRAVLHRFEYPASMSEPPQSALSQDGRFLVLESLSITKAGAFDIWDLTGKQRTRRIEPELFSCRGMNFSPDGKYLALLCETGVSIHSTDGFERLALHRDQFDTTFQCAFATGTIFIMPSKNLGGVRLWDWSKNEDLAVLHQPDWVSETVSPRSGSYLLVSTRSQVLFYPLRLPTEKLTLVGHSGGVPGLAFNPSGAELASVGQDQTLRIWDVNTRELAWQHDNLRGPGQFVAYSANGKVLATTTFSTELVELWDVAKRERLGELGLDEKANGWSAQFSPDGRYIITASSYGTNSGVHVWTNVSRAGPSPVAAALKFFPSDAMSLVLAPNIGRFAFVNRTGEGPWPVYVWDVDGQGPPRLLTQCHIDSVHNHSFTLDGTRLITVDGDRDIITLDVVTGKKVESFPTTHGRHSEERMAGFLILSPDGTKLAMTSVSSLGVDLWEPKTGRLFYSLPEQAGVVWWLEWSPDSKRLAIARSNGEINIWSLSEIEKVLAGLNLKL